jgi:hypothetical protein
MNRSDAIIALSSLLSLAGIWILVMWLGRDYHTEKFRQSLFMLRAELFNLAVDGDISFDHPAYAQLRSTMNGLIGIAHRLSLFSTGLFYILNQGKLPPGMKPFSKRWEENTRNLKPEVKKKLNKQLEKANALLVTHLLVNSPILMGMIIPSALAWICLKLFMHKILSILNEPIDSFDSAAFAIAEM